MTLTVRIQVDTRWAMRFARASLRLWPVLGRDRAQRLATWFAYRLSRFRIGNGAWQRMESRS